ncbi:MAG: hypothetical protein AAB668_00370 [Patescibacteria group bacterium]
MEPPKKRRAGKTILIVLGVCVLIFTLIIGGILAKLAVTNPKALQGDREALLEAAGVKKEDIPTSVTSQQEACAVEKLGQRRVDEIKAGASINASDILKARSCF